MSAPAQLRTLIAAYNAQLTDLDIGMRHYAEAVAELDRVLPGFLKGEQEAPGTPSDPFASVRNSLKHARGFISRSRNEPVLAHIARLEEFVIRIEASFTSSNQLFTKK